MNNILTAYFQQQLSFCCYTSPPLFLMHYIHCFAGFVVLKPLIIIKITLHMKIDLCILMGFFVYLHLNNYFDFHVIPSENQLHFLQLYDKMSLIKVAWCVFRVKNMHPGSTLHPSWTAAAEAKPRCVYSILKPHGQSSR